MIKIEILEEVADSMAMVDLLNHIATMVKQGYTSGFYPHWAIVEVNEKEEVIGG